MLYDTIKFQLEPGFADLIPPNYAQELSTSTYVERNRKAPDELPLQVVKDSSTKVYVTTGFVNSENCPKIGTVLLSHKPRPTITITSKTYVWVKCVGTFGSPDAYDITIETSSSLVPPTASTITGTGFTSCFLLGIVDVEGGGIKEITNVFSGGNLGVESFGSVNMWWLI